MLENASSDPLFSENNEEPHVDTTNVQQLVSIFISATSGLVDLFERTHLAENISAWASIRRGRPKDATSAVNYLVLAVGSQSIDEGSSAQYFQYAKTLALSSLGGDLGTETVQAFALITLYMLRACQINGAFLFFGIAARAAYSIGLHRTEVNSRFGSELHIRRDRLWKSLRVLDLFLSISMDGRMPLLVSWLFASSLVLGVGLLGGFGRILEKYACMSIAALEYFAKNDTHAMQYALIAKSLLSSALEHLRSKDIDERLRILESSSQLFGLMPKESPDQNHVLISSAARSTTTSNPQDTSLPQNLSPHDSPTSPFHDIDPLLLSLGCSLDANSGNSSSNKDQQDQADQVFGALNLFPLLDGNGHIDLAHYF
ncbi:hypothetical protein ABKA04_006977 [Annulohypoxylon sp. FPYF3050]